MTGLDPNLASASTTRHKSPKRFSDASSEPAATKAIWWPTSSAAAARRPRSPRSSVANGSLPTSASSPSTPRAKRLIESAARAEGRGRSRSAPSRCSTSAATSGRPISMSVDRPHRQEEGERRSPQGAGVPRPDPARPTTGGGNEGQPAQDGFFHGKTGRPPRRRWPDQPACRAAVRRGGHHRSAASAGRRAWTCWRSSSRWACSRPCWTRRGKGHRPCAEDIPAEVFDKRAVERGQVGFHDVASSRSRRA